MQNPSLHGLGGSSIPAPARSAKSLGYSSLRAQRIENIGLFSTGIAHDLNNIFSPLMIGVALLRETAKDPKDQLLLEMLEQNVVRGASLVRQLMDYAKGASEEHQPLQVTQVLRELSGVISGTFPRTISLETELSADLWSIKGDFTQIYQILLNLCVNARDAMPRGGVLRLRAENRTVGHPPGRVAPQLPPGPYVVLQVEDTGEGIPPAVVERMWEPFFTTKGEAGGTGLGLSTVRSLIRKHHGFIDVCTQVGTGARFSIHLPAITNG
jgi:two-component system cell cycle sensor histidine kinase/response regulator CckA